MKLIVNLTNREARCIRDFLHYEGTSLEAEADDIQDDSGYGAEKKDYLLMSRAYLKVVDAIDKINP